MPKYGHKKPDRPANLPDEPVESLEKQYYTAPTRVWFVRKDEIGKEGVIIWRTGTVSDTTKSTILHRIIDDESGVIEDISVEYIRMIK
ncbi:MAG: hypothetical protein L6R38_008045 [Xanthoria sp. 2 TBL-2021]|nr:MAG: hypothetical protein L6R38_008045 [Xanthoria sp. 2 TBL-2021]